MYEITANNPEHALYLGLRALTAHGKLEGSRNGPVLAMQGPTIFKYLKPYQRVLFSPLRNANPFFHLMEALWMLAGHNDLEFPASYTKTLELFSDDGKTVNGAYGYRWRQHFGYDQLDVVIKELSINPTSRRCVVAMWDAHDDATVGDQREQIGYEGDLKRAVSGGKDVPCNTHVYFRIVNGELDMTVCNRSNDAVWGAQGANAVHFSLMQEYVARSVGVKLGAYYQFANNYHVYTERDDVKRLLATISDNPLSDRKHYHFGRYDNDLVIPTPLWPGPYPEWRASFDEELSVFMGDPDGHVTAYASPLLRIADRMKRAHLAYKADDLPLAKGILRDNKRDWAVAGYEWLERIEAKRAGIEAEEPEAF